MSDPAIARQARKDKADVRRLAIAEQASRDHGREWGRARRISQRLDPSIRPSMRTVQSVLRELADEDIHKAH